VGETGTHKAHKKVAHSLVALSSAAVLAVYSAGYQRTKAAADRFERLAASRRHAMQPAVARGHAVEGAPATPWNTGGGAAPGAVAHGPVTEDPPATGTVAGTSSAGPAPPPVAPTAVSRAGGSTASEPTPVDRGHVIDGATATPSNTGGVPATSTVQQPAPSVAPTEIAPISPPERGRFKDGTYQGRGSCIHGDIQAEVVVKNGRIVEATISSCETRYSCDWLDPILPQVAARQSAFVDYVSGATDSTDAFSAAVTDALLKAQ
jgi:uncharacterized protein with FMN-binding domain